MRDAPERRLLGQKRSLHRMVMRLQTESLQQAWLAPMAAAARLMSTAELRCTRGSRVCGKHSVLLLHAPRLCGRMSRGCSRHRTHLDARDGGVCEHEAWAAATNHTRQSSPARWQHTSAHTGTHTHTTWHGTARSPRLMKYTVLGRRLPCYAHAGTAGGSARRCCCGCCLWSGHSRPTMLTACCCCRGSVLVLRC
jgi:hypothetical protein